MQNAKMLPIRRPVATALVTAALLAAGAAPVLSQARVQIAVVNVRDVAEGYRTSKLRGAAVVNEDNERIGSIDDVIIGKDKVLFAVLQVGGFLGIGAHLVAVPYQSLQIDRPDGKVVLPGATKDALKALPEFKYV